MVGEGKIRYWLRNVAMTVERRPGPRHEIAACPECGRGMCKTCPENYNACSGCTRSYMTLASTNMIAVTIHKAKAFL
jgi:hypothetical protein